MSEEHGGPGMRAETEGLLIRFLDGELEGAEEERALRRIAGDPRARAMLRFDAGLRATVREARPAAASGSRAAVPPGFTDRVMRAIEAREAARAAPGRAVREPAPEPAGEPGRRRAGADADDGALSGLRRWWSRPRTLVWRPAHALAAAVVVLAALGTATLLELDFGAGDGPGTGGDIAGTPAATGADGLRAAEADTVLVRFMFEEQSARTVAVAGDFTRWEPVELEPRWREGRRVWTGVVAVPRGEHRYMFVVDGSQWVTDPLALAVGDDGFGGRNAILSL